jgi:hypothetical protein
MIDDRLARANTASPVIVPLLSYSQDIIDFDHPSGWAAESQAGNAERHGVELRNGDGREVDVGNETDAKSTSMWW